LAASRTRFGPLSEGVALGAGFALILAIDSWNGPYFSLQILYLLPIAVAAWRLGRKVAYACAILAGVAFALVNVDPSLHGAHPYLLLWRAVSGIGVFAIVAELVSRHRRAIDRLEALASTDPLTDLPTRRVFLEVLEAEVGRASRFGHPLSVAFIDLDDFKKINDTLGHAAGDHVLRATAAVLRDHFRREDVVARIGGDEFAVLLLECDAEEAMRLALRALDATARALRAEGSTVTCSVGLLTCREVRAISAAAVLDRADALMYSVKRAAKSAVRHEVWPQEEAGSGSRRRHAPPAPAGTPVRLRLEATSASRLPRGA
jgi:diguanylate cyclase (GGDEF)-like protein